MKANLVVKGGLWFVPVNILAVLLIKNILFIPCCKKKTMELNDDEMLNAHPFNR